MDKVDVNLEMNPFTKEQMPDKEKPFMALRNDGEVKGYVYLSSGNLISLLDHEEVCGWYEIEDWLDKNHTSWRYLS